MESQLHPAFLSAARAPAAPADPDAPAAKPFGFAWFIPELLKHRHIWRDVLLASFALQLVGLATPLFTQVVIDKVVVHHTQGTLVVIMLAMGLFTIFGGLLTWLRQYLVLHTGNRLDAALGSRVFARLLRLPAPWYTPRPTGTMVARLQGVETIRDFLTGATVTLLLDLPFLLIFIAAMFWYAWQLALIVIGIVSLLVLLSLAVTPAFRARLDRQFLAGARTQAFVTEHLAAIETVKALQLEPRLDARYGEHLSANLSAGFATRHLANHYQLASNTLEQGMNLAVLGVGALLVMEDSGFTIGKLVAFQMFASRVSQPLLRLAGLWQEFQQAAIAVKRLADIMDVPAEPSTLTPVRRPQNGWDIDIQDLGFRYAPDRPWLYRHLDLTLANGQLILITGPSGSGKSTLARLLLGFHAPAEGRIRIAGRDISALAANELRQDIGIVPQETVLFSGTIYDNLALAHPTAGIEDITQAAQWAGIHDTIEALPQGYQTEIGEHGAGLSGGQKQRIAIARALLKRPGILIFDESVSNLDPHSAQHIAATVNALKGHATILFISHLAPENLQADRVIRLGEGKLEESGKPC